MFRLEHSLMALALLIALAQPLSSREQSSGDSAALPSHSLKLDFSVSEPLGLLRFLNGISKLSDEGTGYYDFLIAHHKLNKHDKGFIRRYIQLQKSSSVFETSSGRKLSFHQKLMAIACDKKNFEVFFEAAKQCCDEDELVTLQLVMNHFRPIYEQLIWKPFSPQLYTDRAWFRANEQAFSLPLEAVAKLFKSSAGVDEPLKAILVPAPTEVKKEGNGFIFNSSEFSENLDVAVVISIGTVPPDAIAAFNDQRVNNKRTLEDNDGLIHEFVHTIWAFRSPEFRKALMASFEKADRQFNYDLLNESQAAAIQAWFHKQVTGKDKPGRWYDNIYVDKYAKALLPVLQDYASLDSSNSPRIALNADDYAQKAIAAFEKTFPNWQEDPQIILWRSQVVQSPVSSENLAEELNEKVFAFTGGEHKITMVKGETWPARFAHYSKNPRLATIFLLHPNQLDTLQKYFGIDAQIINELIVLVSKNKSNEQAVVKALRNGQQWMVFSISSRQTLQKQGLIDYARRDLHNGS